MKQIIIALRFLHKFANHEEVLKIFDKVYKTWKLVCVGEEVALRQYITFSRERKNVRISKRASLNDEIRLLLTSLIQL